MARASTFTSYINAEIDSGLDAKWARYEQVATRTYSNIARKAEEASRAVAGLNGGRGTGGAGLGRAADMSRQAAQIRAIDDVNRKIARSSEDASRGLTRQARATTTAARESNVLSRSLSAVSTSLNVVQGPLSPLAGRVSALAGAISDLTGFRLGIAGIASSLFILGSTGNTYAELEGRMRGAFIEQSRVNTAMQDVARIAQATRTALDPVGETYIKISKSAEAFNISQERSARLVETVSKATILSGGSRQTQEAGIGQFGQAFASGTLAGEELKSVRENTFVLAQAIAKGIGVEVAQLKELGAEGKLTTEVLVAALEKASLEIDARFSAMPKTIGQSITELRNSFTLLVGSFDQATGFSSNLASLIGAVAENMRGLAAVALGVGAGFAAIKVGSFVTDMQQAIGRTVAMNKATRDLAQSRKVDAEAMVAFTQRSVAGLNQQQAELRETIALEQRRVATAQRQVARARNDPFGNTESIKAALREQIAAQQALSAAQRAGVANSDALAASQQRLEVAQTRLSRATRVAEGRVGLFRSALRGVIGAINPLGIAIGLATGALISFAMKAGAAETALASFSNETMDAARKAIGLAGANTQLANSYYEIARAMGRKAVAEKREQVGGIQNELAGRLGQIALLAGPGKTREGLLGWMKLVKAGTADIGELSKQLGNLEKSNPRLFKGKLLGFIGPDTSIKGFTNSTVAAFGAQQELNAAIEDQRKIEQEIAEARRENAQPRRQAAQPVSAADLRTSAQADALDSGTSAIRAAGIRRKKALQDLDRELGVANGKVPGDRAQEYRERAAEIERTYNLETQAARGAAKARTAGAREAAAASRQEIKDNRELAKSRLELALLDLEKRKPQLSQQEFYAERVRLLKTYDAEIERIDAAGDHHSSVTQQMIADTREMTRQAEALGEKRRDILAGWDEAPRAIDRARDQIEDLRRSIGSMIEGQGGSLVLYTQEMADEDARRILEGVRRPIEEAARAAEQFRAVAGLRLEGFDLAAEALERALDLQREVGELTREDFDVVVGQVEEQQRINNLLAQRERLLEPILAQVTQTKDAFEEMLVNLPEQGLESIDGFLKNIGQQVRRAYARQISEALFGGAEQRLKDMLGTARGGLDAAYEYLATHARGTGTEFDNLASQSNRAADALATLADSANMLAGGVGGTPESSFADAANKYGLGHLLNSKPLVGAGASVASILAGRGGGGDDNTGDEIVVVGSRQRSASAPGTSSSGARRSPSSGLRALGDEFGGALNKTFNTTFFRKMGDVFQGAGNGMLASSVVGMTGLKQNQTTAAIGGAVGNLVLPGIGGFIGGALGGTIGGLFAKRPRGAGSVTNLGVTGSTNDKALTASLLESGNSLQDTINQIANALGATVGAYDVGIGRYKEYFQVSGRAGDPKLGNSYFGRNSRDALYDGTDEAAAMQAAVKAALMDGAVKGISQASQNILKAGKDLQASIEKALAIESIPKRLLAFKNPTAAAINDLNAEFVKLISYLKEGGATAQQFAEAQELYDLERARAIEQATNQSVSAITDFMEQMTSSGSSPLNKRTVYENASTTLGGLASQINSGKVVDQNALTSAAANFQAASRNLNGSSQAFFADFDMLYDLLGKARANALQGSVDASGNPTLPGSPFESDSTVKALLDQYRGHTNAINDQTTELGNLLREIRDELKGPAAGVLPPAASSPIASLPGFAGGGGGRGFGYTRPTIEQF